MKNILFRYLPLILFLGFFFPNTRFILQEVMAEYRWYVLFGVTGVILVLKISDKYNAISHKPIFTLNKTLFLFDISFIWIGISIIDSVNPTISFLKWIAFIAFIVFCIIYSSLIYRREEINEALSPLIYLFIIIIWITPLAIKYYPQKLLSSLGAINGFFVFSNQLGHFLAIFGTPSILYLLARKYNNSGIAGKLFLIITILLSISLTISSKARAASVITLGIVGIALWRWKGEAQSSLIKKLTVCLLIVLFFNVSGIQQRVVDFLFKYQTHGSHDDILNSRESYWAKTLEAYETRQVFGFGFGVQEQMAEQTYMYESVGVREQGSTFYGLLEEVGLVCSLPIFLCLLVMGWKCGLSLFYSKDELELFLSRVFLTGLGLAFIENYLLYLGNATSILIFFSFFMRERLLALSYSKSDKKSPSRLQLRGSNISLAPKLREQALAPKHLSG